MQRTILCYGDSNTWGFVPSPMYNVQRYSRAERWTGLLQHTLGKDYYIVEEGLNGRTTNLDHRIPPDRNGKTYLPPCLYTHAPIDLVVLALGGNDLKVYFNRKPEQIRDGLAELVDIIQTSLYGKGLQAPPKILIATLFMPSAVAEQYRDDDGIVMFEGAVEKAKSLVGLYADLANEKGCYFLDTSKMVLPSLVDGLHLDAEGHSQFARILGEKITGIFDGGSEL